MIVQSVTTLNNDNNKNGVITYDRLNKLFSGLFKSKTDGLTRSCCLKISNTITERVGLTTMQPVKITDMRHKDILKTSMWVEQIRILIH